MSKFNQVKKLTAIIPTGNEAHNIEAVLQSVAFADEIMVFDSYSTDNTVELARKHTNFILQHKFDNHAAQKNRAIPQASHEWILLVDADERITPELQNEIQEILRDDTDKAAFWIYRDNIFMNKHLKNSGIKNDKCIRLFRKSLCRYEEKLVHEEIVTKGKVGRLQHKMLHNTFVDLDSFYAKMNRYAAAQAQEYAQKVKHVTWYHLWAKPFFRFAKHYIIGAGFCDGFEGYVYACSQKHAVKMRYIKLRILLKEREKMNKSQ